LSKEADDICWLGDTIYGLGWLNIFNSQIIFNYP